MIMRKKNNSMRKTLTSHQIIHCKRHLNQTEALEVEEFQKHSQMLVLGSIQN